MNDWYNDPPEVEEVPECCEMEMEVEWGGACVCSQCGKRIEPQQDPADDLAQLHADYLMDEAKDKALDREREGDE